MHQHFIVSVSVFSAMAIRLNLNLNIGTHVALIQLLTAQVEK